MLHGPQKCRISLRNILIHPDDIGLESHKGLNHLLMFTWGYAKHPCTQLVCTQGFAVGRVERYRCI